jgi:multidrug efflux system membrane fusion protein
MDSSAVSTTKPKTPDSAREDTGAKKPRKGRGWAWVLVLAALGYGAYRVREKVVSLQPSTPAPAARGGASRRIPVVAATARTGDLPNYLNGLGSVTAFNTVTVKSRVDGQLIKILFQEGQFVHQGDVLAEIDPRPFQVQLEQAEGQMARDQAQLKDARANLGRYQALYDAKVIPKQQLDTQAAMVGQFDGAIASDQAAIDNAKLQLNYCRISAPISGRIGLRLVDVGNMVHASDTNGLVVITQLQPIAVLFNLPADHLPEVLEKLRGGRRLTVDAYNRDSTVKLATGTLLTVDNQIDQTTGTSRFKAVFPNENGALFPNQFVNIRVLLDMRKGAVLIPAVAVQQGPQGSYVYVVTDQQTAEARPVTVDATEAGNVSVKEGLKSGERVVVDGQDKLQEGSKVDVRVPGQNRAPGRKGGRKSGEKPAS